MGEFQKTCSAKFEELKPAKHLGVIGQMIVERLDGDLSKGLIIDTDKDKRIIERCTRSEAIDQLNQIKGLFYNGCYHSSGEYLLDGSIDLQLITRSPSLNNLRFRFIPDGKPYKMVRQIKGVAQAFEKLGSAAKSLGKAIGGIVVDDMDDDTPVNVEAYNRFISKPIKRK